MSWDRPLPGEDPDCEHCGGKLRDNRASERGGFRSCPQCSGLNGKFHVFRRFPEEFGQTQARRTARDPAGGQSWCKWCRHVEYLREPDRFAPLELRGEGEWSENPDPGTLCPEVDAAERAQVKARPPLLRRKS